MRRFILQISRDGKNFSSHLCIFHSCEFKNHRVWFGPPTQPSRSLLYMENLRFISRAIIGGHVTPQCRCELSLNPWWIDIGPGFAALFSSPPLLPPPGAVEYAIDYTTDRGGSRCLRLIPIPRNRRSTSHVRFNIFDRYFVPRLSPSHLVLRYTGYGWNYHGCCEFSTNALSVRQDFEIVPSSGFLFRCLSSRKKMGFASKRTWGSRKDAMEMHEDGGEGERDFSRSSF